MLLLLQILKKKYDLIQYANTILIIKKITYFIIKFGKNAWC